MKIVHVDCNNFFVSCERLFRPALEGKPVIVLSNNDGCAIARSNEAKALGVLMGQPFFQLRELERTRGLIALSANFSLYGDLSDRVMSRIQSFVSSVERYSIDECFFTMEQNDLLPLAHLLKETLFKELRMPVSIGIGRTKTEAKLATFFAKRETSFRGVLDFSILSHEEKQKLCQEKPLSSIWGINTRTEERLKQRGLFSVWDFIVTPSHLLRSWGGVCLERIGLELNGFPCSGIEGETPQKQMMYSRSFGVPLSSLSEMKEVVTAFTCRVSEKLRRYGLFASLMTLTLIEKNGISISGSSCLKEPTCCSIALSKASLTKLTSLYRPGTVYKKVAILLSGLLQEASPSFWSTPQDKQNVLMQTYDALRERFGKKALFLAGEGLRTPWKGKPYNGSPHYTTSWDELPAV